jgi:hypothetical protein
MSESKLTPTERLYEMGLAAITKQSHDTRGLFSGGLDTAKTGPNAGQVIWSLAGSQSPDQTPLQWAVSLFDLAEFFQEMTIGLNGAKLEAELKATVEKVKKP